MQLSQSQSSLQQLQAQFSQERQRLTQEIQELEEEHQQRHKSLQEAHILAFQNMEETKEQEQKACLYGYSKLCRESCHFSILCTQLELVKNLHNFNISFSADVLE